ncbi:AAA family ATPase [Poseidonibacter lekithochrous]|uniref:AAA family ATPase n=1 Tax=Poseidonibacter lekithochrous TaxID=1904463 RepID=UPI000D37186C|nr:AAA family ATPase [Poseidonibacter lekithochrous]
MKILKVKSLNINSLKGEFEIDFRTFLNDNALFAITGPTGAGKSTILDIITCALYGRTPRLKQPNELMARHTGESLCEVEFEIKGVVYRSSWTQKRARKSADGKFQTAKMEISDVTTSKVIKSTLRDVPKYVEELSGLDFDRFIQSMMLAQGSFDAFLKAKEADRSTLLEKITGTQIYAKISKEIYDTYSTSKSEIDYDKKSLDDTQLLDEEEVEEKTKALEENKKQKLELDTSEKELIKIKTWLETLSKLELDDKNYSELFAKASKEKEDNKEVFQKLELANKALNVETLYSQQNSLDRDIKNDELTHIKLEADLKELKEKLSSTQTEYELSQKDTNKAKENFDVESKKIKEVRTLQTQIVEKEKSLDDLKVKISTKKEEESKLQKANALIKVEFETIQKQIEITKEYLEENKIDESLIESLPLILKNIKELEDESNILKELLSNKESINKKELEQKTIYDKLAFEVKELKTKYDSHEKEYKALESNSSDDSKKEEELRANAKRIESLQTSLKEYESLIKKIKDEEQSFELNTKEQEHFTSSIKTKQSLANELIEHISTLREKRESELLIKKYEDDRTKLEEGEACFLCGSKEHPFVENHIVSKVNETSTLIDEKDNELKKIESELKSLNSNLSKAEVKIQSSTLEADLLQKQKDSIIEVFKTQSVELNDNTKLNLEEELQSIVESLKSIVKTREEKEKLLKQRDTSNTNFTSKQKEFLDIEKELTQTISKKEQILKDESKSNEKVSSLTEQLSSQYKEYNIVFNIDTYKEEFKTLENRKTTYQSNKSKNKEYESNLNQISINKKENETKLSSLEIELKTDTKNKDEYISSIGELKTKSIKVLNVADINTYELEVNNTLKQVQEKEQKLNQELTALKTKDEELTKQEKILKEKLISSKQTLEELKIKVQYELKNNNFESIESFEKAILSKEQREELSTLCKTIEDKYNEYQTLKTNTIKALEEHKKQDIEIKPIDEVNTELQELQSKIDELQLSIGAVSEVLKRNEQDRQKHQEKILQLEKKKEAFKVWIKLNEMIGSADGNKFAKFAQGITLDQLISLANNHLSVLSSRYELQRSSEQKQLLEIEVIDSFQGNVIRPVSTLSGGESFIVSLSLALGLSELASQKIAIDSLFLDEGFGTLDEDSLETALNALNLLQSSGKMVGVISHVEALKERIPLQIKVVPKGDGTSFVEIS